VSQRTVSNDLSEQNCSKKAVSMTANEHNCSVDSDVSERDEAKEREQAWSRYAKTYAPRADAYTRGPITRRYTAAASFVRDRGRFQPPLRCGLSPELNREGTPVRYRTRCHSPGESRPSRFGGLAQDSGTGFLRRHGLWQFLFPSLRQQLHHHRPAHTQCLRIK